MDDINLRIAEKLTSIGVNVNTIYTKVALNTYTEEQLKFTLLALEQVEVSQEYLLKNVLKEDSNA